MQTVYILTHCRRSDLLYGTTLIFKTVRVGFPTARVIVVDNDSLAAVRPTIRDQAQAAGCEYRQLSGPARLTHHGFIARTVQQHREGTVVFLDPDIVFWANCESWRFEGLIAGRALPRFDDAFTGCATHARLHTSFLWIEDIARLRHAIDLLQRRYFEFDPFTPYMFRQGERWWRFDTGASLHAALGKAVTGFGPAELDCYDHLFCGCHLDLVAGTLEETARRQLEESHAIARGDYRGLKGLWRVQSKYFESHGVEAAAE